MLRYLGLWKVLNIPRLKGMFRYLGLWKVLNIIKKIRTIRIFKYYFNLKPY